MTTGGGLSPDRPHPLTVDKIQPYNDLLLKLLVVPSLLLQPSTGAGAQWCFAQTLTCDVMGWNLRPNLSNEKAGSFLLRDMQYRILMDWRKCGNI